MSKLYRPANGSEGEYFQMEWCARCVKDSEARPCEILLRSMAFGIDEEGFPKQWVMDDNGENARCEAFEAKNNDR